MIDYPRHACICSRARAEASRRFARAASREISNNHRLVVLCGVSVQARSDEAASVVLYRRMADSVLSRPTFERGRHGGVGLRDMIGSGAIVSTAL